MSTVRKNDTRGYGSAIITNKVKSHANDPFFVKKLEEAKAALSNITLPGNNKK
ncbi:hypothetical protein ACVWYN_002394 [Pedobacter sp. UYP24]